MSSDPARAPGSSESALLASLRRPGNELQLTQALGSIAATDPLFARGFLALALDTAGHDRDRSAKRAQLLLDRLPDALTVGIEEQVGGRQSNGGRVDLRFSGARRFRVLIEVKIGAAYGYRQIQRYLSDGDHVLAITRDVCHGEPPPNTSGWLGSVLWGDLLPGLLQLRCNNDVLEGQWRLFAQLLENDNDLGKTIFDRPDLLLSAVDSAEAREQRRRLLEVVWKPAVQLFRQKVERRYGEGASTAIEVTPPKRRARVPSFAVHLNGKAFGEAIKVELRSDDMATTYLPPPRLRLKPPLRRALAELEARGRFTRRAESGFEVVHPLSEHADDPDVRVIRRRVRDLIAEDLDALLRSRALDWDLR